MYSLLYTIHISNYIDIVSDRTKENRLIFECQQFRFDLAGLPNAHECGVKMMQMSCGSCGCFSPPTSLNGESLRPPVGTLATIIYTMAMFSTV